MDDPNNNTPLSPSTSFDLSRDEWDSSNFNSLTKDDMNDEKSENNDVPHDDVPDVLLTKKHSNKRYV